MRPLRVARAVAASSTGQCRLLPAVSLRCQSTSSAPPPPPPSSSSAAAATAPAPAAAKEAVKPQGIRFSRDMGLSEGLEGIGVYAGSISAFVKPAQEKAATSLSAAGGGVLPCEQPGSQAALQAAQAEQMAAVAMTGKLPAPSREPRDAVRLHPPGSPAGVGVGASADDRARARSSSPPSSLPRRAPPAALSEAPRKPPAALATDAAAASASPAAASPRTTSDNVRGISRVTADGARVMRNKEATDYYRTLPQNEMSKEEMWRRINDASADRAEATGTAIGSHEVDYIKLEEELRDFDLFHYRVGEIAYPDLTMRRDYYAMWNLAMSLNKARWSMLEVHSQRGMKTTGAGMKLIFWKESVGAIMEKRKMTQGQFTDSHPVLRPFAAAVERNPHMTKAFVRGFTDARLRVIQQPGNVQQLFDHFDKFYGYFFNTLLEVTHVKDDATEHLMTHIGRATGLTNHCVMFWKKYARLGFTMLPADLCADNHVNLGLLKNIPLASRDGAVRKLLFDVMCIAKDEMLHAQKIAKDVPPKAWPIVMECLYANYYLGFLQRRNFNVSAMFADHNIENAGFTWYRLKKRWEWNRHNSIERLIAEAAPLPLLNTSLAHRGSKYRMASGVGASAPQPEKRKS
ncbi:phytoene synthase [Novymonas esmeraldas]|uniref:Phytoene synthase n=1 Tax=Novymonas esmeraldas TaxID=1808958 RepID=A0AAW0EW31_9TRYP